MANANRPLTAKEWKWSTSSDFKSENLLVTSDCLTIYRIDGGSNPAGLTTTPFSRSQKKFRVKVDRLGSWIGIGVAEKTFKNEGSDPLGMQKGSGLNACLWWSTTSKGVFLAGGSSTNMTDDVQVGDEIAIEIDFDASKIHFWLNSKYIAFVTSAELPGLENNIYACANLSCGTNVTIIPDKTSGGWKWNPQKKGPNLALSDNDLVVTRTSDPGRNPAVLATEPLTPAKNHFRARITELGTWLGIGVADTSFQLTEGTTLGTQANSVNCGYFWQNSGIRRISSVGETTLDAPDAKQNDIIDVIIYYEDCQIMFWLNEKHIGTMKSNKFAGMEGKLYPCVNLSVDTTIQLLNEPIGPLPNQKVYDDYTLYWRWDSKRKSTVLNLSNGGLAVSRTSGGSNPAALSMNPITPQHNHVRFKITQLGGWVGVGFADNSCVLDGGSTVGSQSGVNCTYFWQDSGLHKVQMNGENSIQVEDLALNDIVDMLIDFKAGNIHFWHNKKYQTCMTTQAIVGKEGQIYAAANLSASTTVEIVNGESPPPLPDTKKAAAAEAKVAVQAQAASGAFWVWNPSKKSQHLALAQNGMEVSRDSSGSNPGALATNPLSKDHPMFRIRILKLGNWIGIGFAEQGFILDDDSVLGSQSQCFNAGLFYQSGCNFVCSKQKTEPSQVFSGLKAGMTFDFLLDFADGKVHVYIDGAFHSTTPVSLKEYEGKVYPLAQISAGTSVLLVDDIPDARLLLASLSRTQATFAWDVKASCLNVNDTGLTLSRGSGGSNPAAISKTALNTDRNHFRVRIDQMGSWIGVGVAEESFVLDGGSVIGSQSGCVNNGFFWQGGSELVPTLEAGAVIDIMVDFANAKIHSWLDGRYLEETKVAALSSLSDKLYPCGQISAGTTITLISDAKPNLKIGKETAEDTNEWKWSTDKDKKSEFTTVGRNGLNIVRTTGGSNSAGFATAPLTKDKNSFRVKIETMGAWVGVGIAEASYIVEGSGVIGKQTAFSAGLFQQSRGYLRSSDKNTKDVPNVSAGSNVDILVDFEAKRLHCWVDQQHIGFLDCPELANLEGKVFPIAQLSTNCSVTLVNGAFQLIIPKEEKQKKGEPSKSQVNELEQIIAKYGVPSVPFPTQWSWSNDKGRKAAVIDVSDNNLEVTRSSSSGSNPAIFANMPFTKNSYYFKVKIVALGGWIGIGLADSDFVINNSSTLGSQVACFNSGYFFQGATYKIQTNNSSSIPAKPLKGPGDIMCIKVSFDEKKIYYFLNGQPLGAYEDDKGKIKEGELFPVVNLSLGSTVEIINVVQEDAEISEATPSTPSLTPGRTPGAEPPPSARDKEKEKQQEAVKTGLELTVTIFSGESQESVNVVWDPTATVEDCCRELAQTQNLQDVLPYFGLYSPATSRWLKPKSKLLLYDWKGKTNLMFQQRYKPLKIALPDGIQYLIKVELHLTVDDVVESLKKQLFELTELHFSLKHSQQNRILNKYDDLKDLPDNCMLILEKKQFMINFEIPEIGETFSRFFYYDSFVTDVKAELVAKYELHPMVEKFKEDNWKLFHPQGAEDQIPFYLKPTVPLYSVPTLDNVTLQFKSCKRLLRFKFPSDDELEVATLAGVEVDESKTLGEIIVDLSQLLKFEEPNCYAFQLKIAHWAEWMDSTQTLFQNVLMAQNEHFSLLSKNKTFQILLQYVEDAASRNEIVLVLKNRLLHAVDPTMVANARPRELRRLYLTTLDAVLDGRLPVSKEDALILAALQRKRELANNTYAWYSETELTAGMTPENYLPPVWRKGRGVIKEIWNIFNASTYEWSGLDKMGIEKLYITRAHQNKAFGFSCNVQQSLPGGEIRKFQCGITADAILLINPKTQATVYKFDIVHLKRWAATEDSIILDFGNHDPGVLSLDTDEAAEISSVLDGYVNIMRDTEKFRQLAKFAIRGDESSKIKQKKLNPILVNFKHFNQSMPEDEKAIILHEAIRTGNAAFVDTILDKVAPNVNQLKHYTTQTKTTIQAAIHIAVEFNFLDIVKTLHSKGADLNQPRTVKTSKGSVITETSLHIALNMSVNERYQAMVELLLDLGADTKVLWKCDEGQVIHSKPPLAFAVDNGRLSLVSKLLKHGAELNQYSESLKLGIQIRRESCLHLAANKDVTGEIVALLLENEITLDFTRYVRLEAGNFAWQEENALHIAVRKQNLVVTEMLLKHYVQKNLDPFKTFRKYERNNFFLQLTGEATQSNISDKTNLSWNGNDVASQNNKTKDTALHIAVDSGNIEMLNLVLKYGGNPAQPRIHRYRDVKSYEWPLHIACELGHIQMVKILLGTRGLSVDTFKICESDSGTTILKETALHIATMKGYPEIVDMLLGKGADIDLHRESYQKHATALWLALSSHNDLETELSTKHFGHKTKEVMENQKANFSVIIESLMDAGAVIHGENLPGQDPKQSTPLLLITFRNMREFVDLPQVREEIENYWYPKDMRYHWRNWEYWKILVSFKVPKYRFMSEFAIFALMLALLTTVMLFYSTRNDTSTYYYNQSIRELIVNQNYDIDKTFTDINSEQEFWQWTNGPMAQGFFGTSFVNRYVYVVGNVTLRQLRTRPHDCSQATSKYEHYTLEEGCFAEYGKHTADEAPFGPSGSMFEYSKSKYLDFYSQYVDNWYPIWGGFVQSFDPRRENTTDVQNRLDFMQNSGWIDSHSSAIVFETMLFNGNLNLFSFVRMVFEIPPAGPWIKSSEVVSTRMFYYVTKTDKLILTCEIIVLLLFISFVITEFREMRDQKIRYFYDLWNYLELGIYFVFFGLIVLRIVTISLVSSLTFPPHTDEEKAKYFYVGAVQSQEWNWMAVLGILYWVKLLKYLRLFKRIGILLRVMFLMLQDVFTFLVIFFVIDLGFSLGFHVIAGQYIYQARSWERCFFTMLRMIFGDFDWEEVEATNRYFLMALFFVHIIVSGLLLLNLLIAMFGQSYSRVADQSEQEYLLERAKISLSYSSDFRSKLKEQKGQTELPTENKFDVVIDELPQTMEEVAKKVFSSYDKHNTEQIPFADLKNFVSDFIVEYSHLTGNAVLKVNIPLIQKDAASALENKSFITLKEFLKWCKSKKEDFDQAEATTFQQSTIAEEVMSPIHDLDDWN